MPWGPAASTVVQEKPGQQAGVLPGGREALHNHPWSCTLPTSGRCPRHSRSYGTIRKGVDEHINAPLAPKKKNRWIPRVAAMGAGTVSRPGRAAGGRRGQQYQSPVGAVVTTRGWFLEAKGRVQPPRAMLCHGTAAKMHLASAEGASAGGRAQGTSCHEIPSQAVGRSGAHHPHQLRCAGRGQSHSPHYPKFLGLVEAESSPD